jgi:DNA-binding transcriptional ArsR family regulator
MIQNILVEVLKEFGIEARKEFLNIDVVAKKNNEIITIEIDIGNERAKRNCEKCLFINPKKHIHILINSSPKTLEKYIKEYKGKIKVLSFKIDRRRRKKLQIIYRRPLQTPISEIDKIILNIIRKHPDLSNNQRAKIFVEVSGYSRRTYYRHLKKLRKLNVLNKYGEINEKELSSLLNLKTESKSNSR